MAATCTYVKDAKSIPNWTNVDLYQSSEEHFGIVPIPSDVCSSTGMAPFNAQLDTKRTHAFLAARQHTRIAVLPIHTKPERAMFSQMMKMETGKPRWGEIVLRWNQAAEDVANADIFYKACLSCVAS